MSKRLTNSTVNSQFLNQKTTPYKPQTTNHVVDKSSIIWKDFLNGARKRKADVARLKDAALDNTNSQSVLKRLLLEVRQTTLRLIEDALEIEFRSQNFQSTSTKINTKIIKLPPISSFRNINEKEDLYTLTEIISDVDDLFKIPNIRVMLPYEFPNMRNPFMLGKSVDELAYMIPPHTEPGNVEIELKVLELLRYQRAAKALIRAETQVLNRLPVSLLEFERLFLKMNDDLNLEKLLRCVCTLLDNDRYAVHSSVESVSDLKSLLSPIFNVEAHELVTRLNNYTGIQPVQVDVQTSVRQMLRDCVFDYLNDNASSYLLEWVNIVLGRTQSSLHITSHSGNRGDASNAGSSMMNDARRSPQNHQHMDSTVGKLLDFPDLTQKMTVENYVDMTSVVSMDDNKGTHEGLYLEATALLKVHHQNSVSRPASLSKTAAPSVGFKPKSICLNSARLVAKTSAESRSSPDDHTKLNVQGNRRIRSEVERVIREMGLLPDVALNGTDVEKEVSELNDMRFDLYKMQQELLRRHVLDPRHYGQTDITSQVLSIKRRKGGTSVEDSSINIRQLRGNIDTLPTVLTIREVPMALKTVALLDGSGKAIMEILLDTASESIIGNIVIILGGGHTSDVITSEEGDSLNTRLVSGYVSGTQDSSASIRVSKLIFNRLTQYLLDDLFGAKSDLRAKMLQNIFDQMESRVNEVPRPHGCLLVTANRVLFNSIFTEEGILVEMVILRNDACSGLVIHCTPLSGLNNSGRPGKVRSAGPVSVTVHDRELAVLLINQMGLYELSRTKWASMELVAQWLSSRVRVRKIRTTVELQEEEDDVDRHGSDQKSVSSQVSFDELIRKNSFDIRVKSDLRIGLNNTVGSAARLPVMTHRMMLDVSLDRRVEISSSVLLQWKSRNVPSITGMSVTVTAAQDLEMLVMIIRITFPGGRYSPGLDSAELTDEEQDHDVEHELDVSPPIEMMFRLTSAEIDVFGATEILEPEQRHKRISISTNITRTDEKHPETFIWNLFSRLKVDFQGSKVRPFAQSCSAYEVQNWSLSFNRKLVREIKTVTGRVLVMIVSAVGGDLLFEAETVESSVNKVLIASKLMSTSELKELVHSEGWSLGLLDFALRRDLAVKCLDKLKIVESDEIFGLEVYTFPETQMLKVTLRKGTGHSALDKDQDLGSIEISYHFTLSDLRILIKHELDFEDLPKLFRFLYKGVSCSIKQEPFRRAWECLPRCLIVPKLVETSEISIETDDILHRRMKEQGNKCAVHLPKLVNGQRRVSGKFVAIPLPTLCFVQETSGIMYLLHDSKGILGPGDILRIGNITSRDYIVAADRSEINSNPKTIRIQPQYDLLEEPQFNVPTQGNFAHPRINAGILTNSPLFDHPTCLLKTARQLGYEYEFLNKANEAASLHSNLVLIDGGEVDADSVIKRTKNRKSQIVDQSFADCWLWKCIPFKDDRRPKWRQMYDDGLVHYSYDHTLSELFERHFRVKVAHSYLEILCTDSRCPTLTLHRQRVAEMATISLETYTRLAFDRMTEWLPQYKKGIERTKFMKLMKEVTAFPDLKRPARVAQIDMLFQREVKSENGIIQKYITYAGFCRLLQDLSLIRFPPKRKIHSVTEERYKATGSKDTTTGETNDDDDDESSVGAGEMEDLVSLSDSIVSDKSNANKVSTSLKGKESKRATAKYRTKKQQVEEADKKLAEEATVPVVDPIHVAFAYQKFVLDAIMTYPEWYEAVWREAKLTAMRKEAISYCAATRIVAKFRGGHKCHIYRLFLKNLIILQANIRRKFSFKLTKSFIIILLEDWSFRHRYGMAIHIQSIVRRFLKRCWYYTVMQKVKEQQVLIQKARRFRLKKLRQAAHHGAIYKEAKRANGVMVFVRVLRKDARNYTKDFGITIEVYIPHNQSRFQFTLEEPELRAYMLLELAVEAISAGDILDKRNLQKLVASRLIIHKPSSKFGSQQVIFSKHALGQRGEKTVTRAKRIDHEFFVAKIFETGEDLAVQLYHRLTSKIFTCVMTVYDMFNWITEEYKIACTDDAEREKLPAILKPENKKDYYNWILDHLAIDTRGGQFKLLFSCNLLKSQKMQMIVKIQSAIRRALVRPKVINLLDQFMLKVKVSPVNEDAVYYVNRRTGASSWEKPKLLGRWDLPTKPVRKWVQLTYDDGGVLTTHYVNPFTGKYTHLVPHQAACIIQAVVRNFLLSPITMPMEQFLKAGQIFKSAESHYMTNSSRLSAVINFAMVSHVITLEEDLARKLYCEAVELSEANPLVTRAYAFFMLGTCEAPMMLNRDRAHLLLGDAWRKDSDHSKFQTAYYLFKFACLRRPKDFRTLLNLALVQCVLFDQNHNAEKLLRRALALAPFEERVMEIWKYLKDRFPDRQFMYNSQSRVTRISAVKGVKSKRKVIHGRLVDEDSSWAGWCFVEEDKYCVSKVHKDVSYWYNPADGVESLLPPDLEAQWSVRRNRSQYVGEANGMDQYYDPLTAEYFQYHSLTDTYS